MNSKFNDERNCRYCEFKSPMFNLLSDDELDMLNSGKISVNFRKGETIRKQGAVLTHVISLNTGLAKVYLEGPNNKNLILSIVKPSSFIGGPGMFVDSMNHFTVTSLTDSCVCFIDQKTFKKLLQQNVFFSDAYLAHLSRLTLSAFNRLINLTQKQMAGRLADTLIYLSEEVFEDFKFNLSLVKNDLADLSGMSRDNVVRKLKTFHQENLINYNGKHIELIDIKSLIGISNAS